ncbi:Alpha carbonic anhydrase [Actinidia chinensis var. chinensis]|uniref:Carbonic anhydrase n=1 Tax=Actinidia chinensis var. chinensis TaxID=1590841 RepID=A0A2R6PXK9_ACTCC|nr:Alpha carbonic anhydrase [Actinidia chinensis var. chinensis]
MKKHQSNTIFMLSSLLFLLLLLWHASSVQAQEVEDEREFEYGEGSEKGPHKWGELKKEWEACKHGEMQSPIDMSNQRVKMIQKLKEINREYKPANATVKNRGHDISLQWELGSAGSIKINGSEFFLQQGHWHSPSEHSINGRRYDMELHLVHVLPNPNVKNNIAVIAVLYKIGQPEPFLSQLMKNISSMADTKAERSMGVIDPREIKLGGKRYYRYMGSLTVPPCTEGVIWTISKKVRTVSREQVKLLREAVHDYAERNARPLQPINSREIHLYDPQN